MKKNQRRILFYRVKRRPNAINTTDNKIRYKKCDSCIIYKEETTKMLGTIRTLENVIKILKKENLNKQFTANKIHPAVRKQNTNKAGFVQNGKNYNKVMT